MMASHQMNVLLTGGSGFVGKAVLARLIDQPAYHNIYLLVRGRRGASAAVRVEKMVRQMFPPGRVDALLTKIHAIEGDLTAPDMGLDKDTINHLRREVHQILHVGASTEFGAPLEVARLNNVEGTRHALDFAVDLAETGVLRRFDYVSTAYVAGRKSGIVDEETLVRGQKFSNTYEQSKYEAELLVRDYRSRLKVAIYRPSIVVGDSNSGYTPHFKVLYWPLVVLSRDFIPFFIFNPRAFLDVVPVDYVADAIVALMQRESSLGQTFHLTAGLGREIRNRQFINDAYRLANIRPRPALPFWAFKLIRATPLRLLFREQFWDAVELATPYFAYLLGNKVRFDNAKTQAILTPMGIKSPNWDAYKREVLTYCINSRWGRKLPMAEYVYYLPVSMRPSAG